MAFLITGAVESIQAQVHETFYEHHTYEKYLVWNYTVPPTITPFWFEKCNLQERIEWCIKYWTICLWSTGIYLCLIFAGQMWMKNRAPMKLTRLLTCWNLGLAIFSTIAFFRTVPELFQILSKPNGFHRSVCIRENFNESSAFWGWLYMVSKILELGDTLFIVLRKKPLIFLHWWHHVTVLNAVWITSFHFDPVARWFGIVNLGVHSLMYTYYALKAMHFSIPKKISMALTTIQLGQMVLAVFLNLYSIYVKSTGAPCARSDKGIQIHFSIYFSYLILFSNYFYKAYFSKKTKKE
ncbi:putative fatty acid elongation protein 3 [Orchesella cincta]|uniref:Elongation of very long chain fatty acids protein n=1 Tax=Orchesella cincta TaxID=48709 RepID=A0A1D2NJX4_ORCCI|nr:putative fatty acid elongation protein 3 [Orchesella cincta]